MFLDKIKGAESGVLLYGITPPKASTSAERVAEIAQKTVERLAGFRYCLFCYYARPKVDCFRRYGSAAGRRRYLAGNAGGLTIGFLYV